MEDCRQTVDSPLIHQENAKEILRAGDMFQLEPLKDEAAMFMAKERFFNNFAQFLKLFIFSPIFGCLN
jgi:hypothetical protein